MERSGIRLCAILVFIGVSCVVLAQGTFNEVKTLLSSCIGTQTELPNLAYAKRAVSATVATPPNNCTEVPSLRRSVGPITWYYYDPQPSGDVCNHNTSNSTLDIPDSIFTFVDGTMIATGIGTVTAGPFTEENVTLITTGPNFDPTKCLIPAGLEMRSFTTRLLIGNGTKLTCIGVLTTYTCPGMH